MQTSQGKMRDRENPTYDSPLPWLVGCKTPDTDIYTKNEEVKTSNQKMITSKAKLSSLAETSRWPGVWGRASEFLDQVDISPKSAQTPPSPLWNLGSQNTENNRQTIQWKRWPNRCSRLFSSAHRKSAKLYQYDCIYLEAWNASSICVCGWS